jgi:hypothetical protein
MNRGLSVLRVHVVLLFLCANPERHNGILGAQVLISLMSRDVSAVRPVYGIESSSLTQRNSLGCHFYSVLMTPCRIY